MLVLTRSNKQVKQMEETETICTVCDEAITNPICPDCLEQEMKAWLAGKNPSMVWKLRNWSEIYRGFSTGKTKCIFCGEYMDVCAHCFSQEILDSLKAENPELEEEFITHFNYSLHEVPRLMN